MFKLNLRFNSVTKENRKNFGCYTSTKKTDRQRERDERVLCNIKSCGLLDFNNSHDSARVCVCGYLKKTHDSRAKSSEVGDGARDGDGDGYADGVKRLARRACI